MNATNIYKVPGISGFVVQLEDGTYHATSKSMRILKARISSAYIRQRMARGIEDLTHTAEGRTLLKTANSAAVDMETDRAKTAAAARWGNRGASASIRVDKDVAADLATVPEASRRQMASTAIRRALGADVTVCNAFGFLWGTIGQDVTDAVRKSKTEYIPHKSISADYSAPKAAKILIQNEIDSLVHKLKTAVEGDPSADVMAHVPVNWYHDLDTSRIILGVGKECMPMLAVAAYMAYIEWTKL